MLISKTEKAYLVIFACVVSILSLCNIAIVSLYPVFYPPSFGIYDMARSSFFDLFRFLIILIPLFLLRSKRFFAVTIYTVIALVPAYVQFAWAYEAITNQWESFNNYSSLRILWLIANPLDYVTFIFCNILLIWFFTVVVRGFTAQMEPIDQ